MLHWFRRVAEEAPTIVKWEDKSSDQGFRSDLGMTPTYPAIFTVELSTGDVYDMVWGLGVVEGYQLDHKTSRKNGEPAESGELDAVASLVYDHPQAGEAWQKYAEIAIEKMHDW